MLEIQKPLEKYELLLITMWYSYDIIMWYIFDKKKIVFNKMKIWSCHLKTQLYLISSEISIFVQNWNDRCIMREKVFCRIHFQESDSLKNIKVVKEDRISLILSFPIQTHRKWLTLYTMSPYARYGRDCTVS